MQIYIFSRYDVSACMPINNNFTSEKTHIECLDAAPVHGMTTTECLDYALRPCGHKLTSASIASQ